MYHFAVPESMTNWFHHKYIHLKVSSNSDEITVWDNKHTAKGLINKQIGQDRAHRVSGVALHKSTVGKFDIYELIPVDDSDTVTTLKKRVAALEGENQALEKENQTLKDMIESDAEESPSQSKGYRAE